MGLFSAIGGAISGAIGSIASGIGSICGKLGGSFTGGSIGKAIEGIMSPLPMGKLETFIRALDLVCTIVSTVADILGLKEPEETPEELAMKAEKSDKKPSDFDSTNEYIQYIRNEVELSSSEKEKLKSMSPEERAKYQVIGTGMYIKEIQDKYAVIIPYEFWTDMVKIKAKGEEVKGFLDKFDEKGEKSMSDLTDYLYARNIGSGKSRSEIGGLIREAYKEMNPDLTEDEIADRIIAMRNDIQEK